MRQTSVARDRTAALSYRGAQVSLNLGSMGVDAVIFDWGGTLTPWHSIDAAKLWSAVCAPHFPSGEVASVAAALLAAEDELWRLSRTEQRSAGMSALFALAGVTATEAFLASYVDAWQPHTFTDPDVPELLAFLRGGGVKIGVLSNTMWPRAAHERIFARDDVLSLIDGAVYSSEIPWTKPHPEAFRAAMNAVGETDPGACVFVGDRPRDDIYGAKSLGMRAVLLPNSDVPAHDSVVPDAVITRLADLPAHLDNWA